MTKLYDTTNWPRQGMDVEDYPFIGAIDARPAISRVLDVAGQKFSVGIMGKDYAGVRRLAAAIDRSPEPKEFEQNIICPYCGHVYRDSFERSDEDTTECQICGGTIHYERIVTVEYTTEPVKPPKPIRARWVSGVET